MDSIRPELNFRTRRILYAAVTEYIATGEPVGSRKLAKRYGLNLSPATIRNVLADLEDAGYLRQPHTSAGRVPTDAGFRVFVDALMQMREVGTDERDRILERLRGVPGDAVLGEAGALLSSLTGAAAVVSTPNPDAERLAQLRFMSLGENQVLLVLVTQSGAIQNRVVPRPEGVHSEDLERVNNLIDALLAARGVGSSLATQGASLTGVRDALLADLESERGVAEELRRHAQLMVQAAMEESPRPKLRIAGQGLLFDRPEFLDSEKIRSFLRAFEDKERLLGLLERALISGGVQVLIGQEAALDGVSDVSLITSSYSSSGTNAGSLGVIGPTRMDYAKVVPLVGYTAKVVGNVLSGDEFPEESD